MFELISLLALVVSVVCLVIVVDANKRLRDTIMVLGGLLKEHKRLVGVQRETQDVLNLIAEKPTVTLHTIAETPSETANAAK